MKRSDLKQKSRRVSVVLRRTLLVLSTTVLLAALARTWGHFLISNEGGDGTPWLQSILGASYLDHRPTAPTGEDEVEQTQPTQAPPLPEDVPFIPQTVLRTDLFNGTVDPWEGHPDGIRIETIHGRTYDAHVMLIRDPSGVYLATSTTRFSKDIPGTRIHNQIRTEGAIAAINGGAFFDDGTSAPHIGSIPLGLTVSKGKIVWDDGKSQEGFVGFDRNDVLVVSDTMTASRATELGIRDGCCFGPTLLINGEATNTSSSRNNGFNPRTAIGQRPDGTVIFLCIDGRQPGSLGGTYEDVIEIMRAYGAVNACNLDGGASTSMLYRDTYGAIGARGAVPPVNSSGLLQAVPRKMPTFFMVRPAEGDQ